MKYIDIARTERIVAIVPESACGPGWTNRLYWVHIVDSATNMHRLESIQPNESTERLTALFSVRLHTV